MQESRGLHLATQIFDPIIDRHWANLARGHRLDVAADAKRAAGAGQHYSRHGRIRDSPPCRIKQHFKDRGIERVPALGPIERGREEPVFKRFNQDIAHDAARYADEISRSEAVLRRVRRALAFSPSVVSRRLSWPRFWQYAIFATIAVAGGNAWPTPTFSTTSTISSPSQRARHCARRTDQRRTALILMAHTSRAGARAFLHVGSNRRETPVRRARPPSHASLRLLKPPSRRLSRHRQCRFLVFGFRVTNALQASNNSRRRVSHSERL